MFILSTNCACLLYFEIPGGCSFMPNCILSLFLTAPILFWIFYTFVKVVLCVPMRFDLFKPNCMLNLVCQLLYPCLPAVEYLLNAAFCCVSWLCQPPSVFLVALVLVCCFVLYLSCLSFPGACCLVEPTPSPFPRCVFFSSPREVLSKKFQDAIH